MTFNKKNQLLNIYNYYKFFLKLNPDQSYCKFQLLVLFMPFGRTKNKYFPSSM